MTRSAQPVEVIRELTAADHDAIAVLAKRCFPPNQARYVVPSNMGGKVITVNDTVVAAVLLRRIDLPSGERIGFVSWLMSDPDYRGHGFARKLVESSIATFESHGCNDIVTDVEGYNTASANTFYRAGFRRITLWQQYRRWKARDLLWLSIKCGYVVDPGHFLWVKDAIPQKHSSWRNRGAAFVYNTLLALIALALGGGLFLSGRPRVPSIQTAAAFLIGVISLLAVRELGIRISAWRQKTPLEYRSWSGGWGISLAIALGFGQTFPLPGNLYPPGDGWRVRDYQTLFGRGAFMSTLLLAGLIGLGGIWGGSDHEFVDALARSLQFVGKPLLVFDTLIAIGPFEGFNGRHLRDYNRYVWLALSALAVGIFFFV